MVNYMSLIQLLKGLESDRSIVYILDNEVAFLTFSWEVGLFFYFFIKKIKIKMDGMLN